MGGLLSRSRTSAQGAPESSRILIVVVFPRVVVSSVVKDVLNFNGTPAAKGGVPYYAGHARLHDLAHIP
jgi:hypothetical protein